MNESIIDQYEKPEQVQVAYATFWTRVGSSLLDGIILLPVTSGLSFYCMIYAKMYVLALLPSLFTLGYKVWMEATYGATLGKKINGIRVLSTSLEPITYKQALTRNYFYVVSVIFAMFHQYHIYSLPELQSAHSFLEVAAVLQLQAPLYKAGGYILFAIFAIDCLLMLRSSRKQTIHDSLADTVVIKNSLV